MTKSAIQENIRLLRASGLVLHVPQNGHPHRKHQLTYGNHGCKPELGRPLTLLELPDGVIVLRPSRAFFGASSLKSQRGLAVRISPERHRPLCLSFAKSCDGAAPLVASRSNPTGHDPAFSH
jgi:hypothetical protein